MLHVTTVLSKMPYILYLAQSNFQVATIVVHFEILHNIVVLVGSLHSIFVIEETPYFNAVRNRLVPLFNKIFVFTFLPP